MKSHKEPAFRILLLDTKPENPNHYICLAIERALKQDPLVEFVIRSNLFDAIADAKQSACNLFFAFDGERVDPLLCKRLSEICGISVVWFTEDPYEININIKNSQYFDLIFTNDKGVAHLYGSKGRALVLGCDERFHFHPVLNDQEITDKRGYDLMFVGTAWPNRVEIIQKILPELKDRRIKLALPTNIHLPKFDIGLPQSDYNWRVPNSEFCKLANRSRINLTIHRSFTVSGGKAEAETPGPRIFEIACAGGFQLVDNTTASSDAYFSTKTEIELFSSPEECVEKTKYFIAHPEERIQKAKNAQTRAMKDHRYSSRVEYLLSEVALLRKSLTKTTLPLKNKKRVLVVSHSAIEVNRGGVEIYQDLVARELNSEIDFFFFTPNYDGDPSFEFKLFNQDRKFKKTYRTSRSVSSLDLDHPELEKVAAQAMADCSADVVHFHHLIGLVPSLVEVAKIYGLKTIFSIHDYYPVCESYNLLDYNGKYCNIFDKPISTCDYCLYRLKGLPEGSQKKRRSAFAKVFADVDAIVFNTQGVYDHYLKLFPGIDSQKVNIFAPPSHTVPFQSKTSAEGPLKVIIANGIYPKKGGNTILRILDYLADDPIEFHVLGRVDHIYSEELLQAKIKNIVFHGKYDAKKLAEVTKNADLALHLSIWPETYCMSLTEMMDAGVVPIVSDLGALAERIIDGKNGFKVTPDEPAPVIKLLRDLSKDRKLIQKIVPALSSSSEPKSDNCVISLKKMYLDSVDIPLMESITASLSLKDTGHQGVHTQSADRILSHRLPIRDGREFTLISRLETDKFIYRTLKKIVRFANFYERNGFQNTVFKLKTVLKNHLKRILRR